MRVTARLIFGLFFIAALVYTGVVHAVHKWKCPHRTETEMRMRIFDSILLNFDCE